MVFKHDVVIVGAGLAGLRAAMEIATGAIHFFHSRAIDTEILAGRGIKGRDYVHLDLTHLGEKVLAEKLSEITSFAKIYLGIDAAKEPIPVAPTCHYMMGGIQTGSHGRVLDASQNPVPGLYAAGECSCLSLHGANRLGCNSLLDLVVFGLRAGKSILEDLKAGAEGGGGSAIIIQAGHHNHLPTPGEVILIWK